jgi:hypothetical protein
MYEFDITLIWLLIKTLPDFQVDVREEFREEKDFRRVVLESIQ